MRRLLSTPALCAVTTFLSLTTCLAQLPAQQIKPAQISDRVLFGRVFQHVAILKQMADEAQSKGEDRSGLRKIVQRQAGLTDAEGAILERIALECGAALASVDSRARAIVERSQARYPYGIANPSFLPTPSPELRAMQQERNGVVLLSRDRLRNELGEESFAKFDAFVRHEAAEVRSTPAR
jgi:hypothetical protein